MGKRKNSEKNPSIIWHPAFIEAIKLELNDYKDVLEFHSEYQLTAEPLRIDCVVIKKEKDIIIRKNIAAIFREVNLLEYKSPEDYASITDFYKVYSYACLLVSLENISVTSLTISFVVNRYLKALIAHLKKARKFSVEVTNKGIYTVTGDIFPIQVINSRRLSAEENLWLRDLCRKLVPNEMFRIITELSKYDKGHNAEAYLDVIIRANNESLWEMINMGDKALSFDEIMEKSGMAAKWEANGEAKGEERKAIEVARNMIRLGLPFETIIAVTNLESEKVKSLYCV